VQIQTFGIRLSVSTALQRDRFDVHCHSCIFVGVNQEHTVVSILFRLGSKMSELEHDSVVNKRRAATLLKQEAPPANAPNPSVLVIARHGDNGSGGLGAGWDVIIPKGWSRVFWRAFVFAGARAIGMRERNRNIAESGAPVFPVSGVYDAFVLSWICFVDFFVTWTDLQNCQCRRETSRIPLLAPSTIELLPRHNLRLTHESRLRNDATITSCVWLAPFKLIGRVCLGWVKLVQSTSCARVQSLQTRFSPVRNLHHHLFVYALSVSVVALPDTCQ
jgi:hypothetical protein